MTELTPERLADYEGAMARLPYSSPMLVDYDALQAFIAYARERDALKDRVAGLESDINALVEAIARRSKPRSGTDIWELFAFVRLNYPKLWRRFGGAPDNGFNHHAQQ